MSYPVKNGQTSVVLRFKLMDSTNAVGAGLTGLTNASSGLIISTIADNEASAVAYTVAGSTVETIATLGTFAAPTATKCRFKEVDATNHKGVYEFQFADARFAVSSAKSLLVSVAGATNLAQVDFVVPLVSDDPYVAKPTNYASLSIDASGRVDVIKIAGTTQTARDIGASVLLSPGTGTGQLDFTSGVVKANATQWLGGTIPAVNVTGVPLIDLKYTLGTISPATAGSVRADAVTGLTASDVGAIKTQTDKFVFTVANQVDSNVKSNAGTAITAASGIQEVKVASIAANAITATSINADAITDAKVASDVTIASVTGAVGSVTGAVGSVTGLTASDVGAIKTQTDKLAFTVANQIDANVLDWKSATAPAMTGDAFARMGAPAGASVSADIAAVKVDTAAIKAKTDNLPSDPADASDIAGAFSTVNTTLSTIAGYIDTEVAAIKTQTDKLVFTVANQVDVNVKSNAGTAITAAAGVQEVKVASIAANAITATAIATDAITAAKIADGAIDAATFAVGAIDAAAIADGAIDAATLASDTITAAKIATGAITSAKFAAGAIDNAAIAADAIGASELAASAVNEIVDQVWEEALTDHSSTSGSTAEALSAATSDPWATALPGSYGSGAAGKIIGDNINATVSSRASQTSVDTIDDYVDTEVAAIKAKTDNLPASPAATGDIPTANQNADALLDRADAIEAGVTPRKALRLQSAVLGAKLSGAGTGTEVFRNAVADAKDRVTATVDNSGNRTAITYDLT